TYDIGTHFTEVISVLKASEINMDGLFMNADSGFDCRHLRTLCFQHGIIANFASNKRNKMTANDDDNYFDPELYEERYSIERTNAWLDSFRSLLNRHDTTVTSWKALNYIAFIVISLKKSKKFK
uniref:transposase n=1 Tax=uncultured Chryseobacterium sp. TaxID=259322 RepID=UPI0025F47F75